MGTDIHIVIQVYEYDRWTTVPYRELLEDGSIWPRESQADIVLPGHFTSRCYSLFGILADVRNGTGFGGCVTGDPWPYIAEPRGLPPECDDADDYLGDHSFTYITLEELQAYPWDTVVRRQRGLLTQDDYHNFALTGERPAVWCGGVFGGRTVTYTEAEYAGLVAANLVPTDADVYIEAWWKETAREATADWAGEILPALEDVAAGRPLRLVIGFDS